MVTIKDIARECNVSVSTVSNVINGKDKMGEDMSQFTVPDIGIPTVMAYACEVGV